MDQINHVLPDNLWNEEMEETMLSYFLNTGNQSHMQNINLENKSVLASASAEPLPPSPMLLVDSSASSSSASTSNNVNLLNKHNYVGANRRNHERYHNHYNHLQIQGQGISPTSDPLTLLYQQQGISPNSQMHADGHIFMNISPNSLVAMNHDKSSKLGLSDHNGCHHHNTNSKVPQSQSNHHHLMSNNTSQNQNNTPASSVFGVNYEDRNQRNGIRTPSVEYYSSSNSSSSSNSRMRYNKGNQSSLDKTSIHNNPSRLVPSVLTEDKPKISSQSSSIKNQDQHVEWLQHMNWLALKSHYKAAVETQTHQPKLQSHSKTENSGIYPIQEDVVVSRPPPISSIPQALQNVEKQQQRQRQRNKSTLAETVQAQAEENFTRLSIAMNLPRVGDRLHPFATLPPPIGLHHQQPPQFAYTTTSTKHGKKKVEENAQEKRARRLARNRESARQSRRRKKEQLLGMGDKVVKMWDTFEIERWKIVVVMGRDLNAKLLHELSRISDKSDNASINDQTLAFISGFVRCNSSIRMAVIEFQYRSYLRYILPTFRRYLLWLSLQPPRFFRELKEEYQHRKPNGRISSKQVGEEICESIQIQNETSCTDVNTSVPAVCNRNSSELWPLFCLELSIGLDQEDRFISVVTDIQEKYNEDREKLKSTIGIVKNMRRLTSSHMDSVGNRQTRCLQNILNPDQSIRYLSWMKEKRNRLRCKNNFLHHTNDKFTPTLQRSSVNSLNDLCQSLDKALNINNDV